MKKTIITLAREIPLAFLPPARAAAMLLLGMAGVISAIAAPTMRLSADGGVTWTVVTDNGLLDSNPSTGAVTYTGPVGGWLVSVSAGLGEPALGSLTTPSMDLSTVNVSTGPASLIVQMSDTNFVPFPNETFISSISLNTGGTMTYNTYRDSGNVLFGTTESYPSDPAGISPSPTSATLIDEGPFSNGAYYSSNSVVVPNGTGPFSLTLETTVIHTGAAQSQSDASLEALPPPACNCTVTFNAPASLTNCAGDTIADVTASQDCGSGPTPVTVTVVGAVTNGVCPQIITRTNTATDTCGTVHTFVQAITVNCLPNCTITTSVTSTTVGTSNLTASVANAGPGATYSWNIVNGTITAGQGTRTITWTAGTDTSNPVSITVKVTTAAGCQNNCTASLPLGPKPPACTITGVTISDTSWNQFNIPNGTSPVVWVHLHTGKISGIPTTGVTTVQFVNVTFTLNGTSYSLPDGVMTFDSSAPATITTTFSGGKWQTLINPKDMSDEMFFTGAAIPVTAAIATGGKATLTYTTLSSVAGLSFSWQWSAAVYTYWPTDWNQAMILPYHQSDHAGTPENTTVQKSLIQGPRGGGGSNYTGSWSATGNAACQ